MFDLGPIVNLDTAEDDDRAVVGHADHRPAGLVLAAADVDAGPLVRWLTEEIRPGGRFDLRPLADLDAEPGLALDPDRVILVIECGRLLTPAVARGAALIMARPAPTYAIVAVGAEVMQSPADIELVERGLWQVLLDDTESWRGQNLLGRRCALWSGTVETGNDRLDRDRAWLANWVRGEPDGMNLMEALRREVSEAAEPETARLAKAGASVSGPSTDASIRRLRTLRDEVGALGRRLRSRLDADVALCLREVKTSLLTLDQDLLHGIDHQLDRPGWPPGDAAEATRRLGLYLDTEISLRWTNLERALHQRLETREINEVLNNFDWSAVEACCPPTSGPGYPKRIQARLRAAGSASIPVKPEIELPGDLPLTPPWNRAIRVAAYGAVLGGIAAVTAGPAAVMAAAAGAAGGWYFDRKIGDRRLRATLAARTKASVSRGISASSIRLLDGVQRDASILREALASEFAELDHALARASVEAASEFREVRAVTTPRR